jgi:hypothetical protein
MSAPTDEAFFARTRSEGPLSTLCGRIKRASLKCLGPSEALSLTGEMRTPLDSKQVLLFDLEIWFLLLLLVK